MADDSLIRQLMEASQNDPIIYAALSRYYQNNIPLDEVLVGCVLILSAQLKAANQALVDHLEHYPYPHRTER